MACKFCHILFRVLFSVALICVAMKGCYEINDNKGFVSQNIRLIGEKLFKADKFYNYRAFSGLIIIVENYLFIMTACLVVFGSGVAKFTAFIAVAIELLLVHNPLFYREDVHETVTSLYLGVLGAVLCF